MQKYREQVRDFYNEQIAEKKAEIRAEVRKAIDSIELEGLMMGTRK